MRERESRGCEQCSDGFVVLKSGSSHYDYAYSCLCPTGQLRAKYAASVASVLTPAQIFEMWPSGVPSPLRGVTDDDLKAAGVPLLCLHWTLHSLGKLAKQRKDSELEKYVGLAHEWVKGGETSSRADVVIFGPNGTCKTGIAISMMREMLSQHQTGCFVTVRDMLDTLRATYRDDADVSERSARSRFESVGVLVLDELSGARGSDYAIDTLTAIVDKRQKSGKPTIFTTNLGQDKTALDATNELASFVGPTLFDRLRASAAFWAMFGKSRRVTNRKLVDIGDYRKEGVE